MLVCGSSPIPPCGLDRVQKPESSGFFLVLTPKQTSEKIFSPGTCPGLQKPALFMKLRRESVEKVDISGPEGKIEFLFSGPDCIEIRLGLKKEIRPERSALSALAAEGFMNNAG